MKALSAALLLLVFAFDASAVATFYWPYRQLPADPYPASSLDMEINPATGYPAIAYIRLGTHPTMLFCWEYCYSEFDGDDWHTQTICKYDQVPPVWMGPTSIDLAYDAQNRPVVAFGENWDAPDDPPPNDYEDFTYRIVVFWKANIGDPGWSYCIPHTVASEYPIDQEGPTDRIPSISMSRSATPGYMSIAFSEQRRYFVRSQSPQTFHQLYWYEFQLVHLSEHNATDEMPQPYGATSSAFWSSSPRSEASNLCYVSQAINPSGANELCYTKHAPSGAVQLLYWSPSLPAETCLSDGNVKWQSFSINPVTGERYIAYSKNNNSTFVSFQNTYGVWQATQVFGASTAPTCVASPTLGPLVLLNQSSPGTTPLRVIVGIPSAPGQPPSTWAQYTDRQYVCTNLGFIIEGTSMVVDPVTGCPYVAVLDGNVNVAESRRVVVKATASDGQPLTYANFTVNGADTWLSEMDFRHMEGNSCWNYCTMIPPNAPNESRNVMVGCPDYETTTVACPTLGVANTVVLTVTLYPDDDCGTTPATTKGGLETKALLPISGSILLLLTFGALKLVRARRRRGEA